MTEGLLQVEIPDFGSSVLGSLNQQRLLGHHCDVSILVQGQLFKAHRAVLAASSLYFRDLFSAESSEASESSQVTFELPSSVTPACFRQILSFCYTGRLHMAPSEQLVLMYTAGYLQIQNIVERGLELMMMKSSSSSPYCCDSQTTSADELGASDLVQQPQQGASPSMSPEELLMAVSRIKQERQDSPPGEDMEARAELQTTTGGAVCYLGAGAGVVLGLQSYLLAGGGRSSSEGTDSPPSHPPTEEELEDNYFCNSSQSGMFQHMFGQEKMELLRLPLGGERRACVLVGGDNMALPASLVSQIGYRCHPSLYGEGEPGEKVELVAGSGVFMTRGQLMNCHLCAGVKHKVLLRRLLATFFDRNTLANSCGTGIRSSTNDPSRKPLDNRVLNTVKLYCQKFAPSFKESEMNVIAADMCTNARRVRKRWLPKIHSLLPGGLANSAPQPRRARRGGAVRAGGGDVHLELDPRPPGGQEVDREEPHLQLVGSRGGGARQMGVDAGSDGRSQHQDPALCVSSSYSPESSPYLAETAPPDTDDRGAEPLQHSQ
ncbi:nucleus accumbens-associated protein 2-like [Nerophis lumbriciformis]|uniref:nucleus accumbens-associated protein 2-like n=1 Tax=Nerophis lumbriciformis TaxID=546530 RepID=UPI002ADFBAAD|nr:nucleus accumbens-associated protein 2-like [Nerophis lumbriciformis]